MGFRGWLVVINVLLVLLLFIRTGQSSPASRPVKRPDLAPALRAAVREGNAAAVERLLREGADPDLRLEPAGQDPGAPLLWAAAKQVYRWLISGDEQRACLVQSQEHPEYREVMRLLLEQGADPDTSHGGETPLMAAAGSASPYVRRANGTHDHAPAPDDAATVALLLRHGAHPDLRNPAGASALMLAAAAGSPGVVRALATAGADLNARDQRGETAFHRAASEGHVACVDALLIAGADVNPLDSVKVRPVTRACQKGHGEIVARLLAHGADPNDSVGLESSLWRAESEGHTDVAQALHRYSSRTRTTGLW